jgi:hypothetical protein
MPYTSKDAYRHTHKATTPKKRRAWRKVANKVLKSKKYGKRKEEAAVRIANSVVNRLSGGAGRDNYGASPSLRRKVNNLIRRRKSGPGRKSGFKHSAATKKKISVALKKHHRKRTRKSRR